MEYQMIDQHAKQMHHQLEAVTQQIMELTSAKSSLDEFEGISEGKEILVPISSGIFAKASLKKNSELIVNVGANVAVTKDMSQAKELIGKQLEDIKNLHRRMVEELEKLSERAAELEGKLQQE